MQAEAEVHHRTQAETLERPLNHPSADEPRAPAGRKQKGLAQAGDEKGEQHPGSHEL